MEILLKIIVVIASIMLVLGFGALGALIVYLTEDEKYENNKRNDEVSTHEMDTR